MKKIPNAIDVHVGSRIRLRRTMLGMSQEKLGDGLGLTFQQVQKYEKGTNRVGASRLQHIAELLDVPIPFFFEGGPGAISDGTDSGSSVLTEFMKSREGIALAAAFSAIEDKRVRQTVLNLIRSLGVDSDASPQSDDARKAAQ